jgi:hypothetical protein
MMICPLFAVHYKEPGHWHQACIYIRAETMKKASGKFASDVGVANREGAGDNALRAPWDEEF